MSHPESFHDAPNLMHSDIKYSACWGALQLLPFDDKMFNRIEDVFI